MLFRIRICLIAAVCAAAVTAQSSPSANAASVAYAFVSTANPNNVYSLAVSSSGSFTHVGTASSPTVIYHLSVTKKFLFGIDNASNIYTYSISSAGALKLVATTNAGSYVSGFNAAYAIAMLQVDQTGGYVYCTIPTSGPDWDMASFKIESNGQLQFLGTSYADPFATQIRFVQDNQFALASGSYLTQSGGSSNTDSYCVTDIVSYRRESNGFLTYLGISHDTPTPESPHQYCAGPSASDSSNHLATNFSVWDPTSGTTGADSVLGVYTASSSGYPSTTSDYQNMPTTSIFATAISIDPTGKLLAIGGQGYYQFFHFNGANPISSYSQVIKENDQVSAFGWDKNSHFYMLTGHSVDIYNITPTSYTELKPWEFTNPYSMIVLTE
jgi:hypothetical protein